jgi:nitrite reductase/ring-hydroxylating ferredoxin subunit
MERSERMENSAKPDLKAGFPIDNLPDGGMTLGQADGEDVIVARRGDELFAIGASCTHYHGPLADGLIVGETVRCPWHHACFSLRTGGHYERPHSTRLLAGASKGSATRFMFEKSWPKSVGSQRSVYRIRGTCQPRW